jgi:hypothetical protein
MEDKSLPIYLTPKYLKALKESLPENCKLILVRIIKGKELIAVGCFQEVLLDFKSINSFGSLFSSENRILILLERLIKNLLSNFKSKIRLLIIGNAQVSGPNGIWFKENVTESEKAFYWDLIIDKVEKKPKNPDVIIIKDLINSSVSVSETIKSNKFNEVKVLPVMNLKINPEWGLVSDYYKAFSSKYRIRAQRARKKLIGINQIELTIDDLTLIKKDIHILYNNVYNRARFRLLKASDSYLFELKKNLKEDIIINAYFKNEELIGFYSILKNKSTIDAHLIGLNYDSNKNHALYLNMLYDITEVAINSKSKIIDFGRTAMEIKSTVGAEPIEEKVFLKFNSTILNYISAYVLNKNSNELWTQRHPFR